MSEDNLQGLDAIVDAVLLRLAGRLAAQAAPNSGPAGEPVPGLPDLPHVVQGIPSLPRPRLALQGIELTQSTQHYGTAYGADNSVPIVALKDMVVRAYPYVEPGLTGADLLTGQAVTGELVLSQWNQEVYRTGPTRPAGVRLGRESDLDRTLWDQETTLSFTSPGLADLVRIHRNPTLNFRVPGWYLRAGPMTATVSLRLVSAARSVIPVIASQSVQVLDVRAPRVGLVRVNWKDSSNAVTTLSDADMLATVGLAGRMLPFPYFDATILGAELTKSGDFSGPPPKPGGCNAQWVDLLTGLEITRLFMGLFQLGDIAFALVPAAARLTVAGTLNTGCGWGDKGVGGCFVGDGLSFAHEMGHEFGRPHVAVPGDAGDDPTYPNYGGSPTSIGEVGLDTGGGATPLHDPSTTSDLMSYQGPQWISPYTYEKILDARSNHESAAADPRRVRPILVTAFRVERLSDGQRQIDVQIAHKVAGPGHLPGKATWRTSAISIDLMDKEGRILATHHADPVVSTGAGCCGCGGAIEDDRQPYLQFVEAIEWPEGVARLAFHRGGPPIATLEVGKPPKVEISDPKWTEEGVTLKVSVQHPRATPSVAILFTGDDGEHWEPLVFDPPADEPIKIARSRLRGGTRCRFRLIATAEFQSATADGAAFDLPAAGRQLFVTAASKACGPGEAKLQAFVDTHGRGPIHPAEITWRSDRDGALGAGYALIARLSRGRHVVTAIIPDGLGGVASQAATITV